MRNRKTRLVSVLFLITVILGISSVLPVRAQDAPGPADGIAGSNAPAWLEPRGISVLDMVGQVPEWHLRGSMLVFDEAGVAQYMRGRRDGDKVTIEVSMSSYENPYFTEFTCLGRRPLFDEWPVAVPPSEMRIFSAGDDITSDVYGAFWYFPAEQALPIGGSRATAGLVERYEENINGHVDRTATGAIAVPANMGCTYFLWGSVPDLTATFVFDYPKQLYIEPLGNETFTFHSYVGIGEAGRLTSLSDQLRARFPNRHDKFHVDAPAGADFVWLNYPPTPVSPYASSTSKLEHNIRLPSSGTYRLIGYGDTKSVDHVTSMGLPLQAQWIDSDLHHADETWLERTAPIELVSAPEYFVPPGIAYHPCMKDGGCPDELLDSIWNKEAEMTLHFYRVRRLQSSNLMRVPLRQVGPDWDQDASTAADEPTGDRFEWQTAAEAVEAPATVVPPNSRLLLPFVQITSVPRTFPDDPPQADCPCGWFDEYFRLLDVIPGL